MRIGIDARVLAGRNTGIGTYAAGLIRGLATVDCRNEYFLFIGAGDVSRVDDLELPSRFVKVSVPPLPIDQLQDQAGLPVRMIQLGLHVFHSTAHYLTPLLSPVPLVVTVHDIMVLDFPCSSWIHRAYFSLISRLALWRARHLLCDSTYTGQRIEHRFPYCAGKWATVYIGRDLFFDLHDDPKGFSELGDRLGIRSPFMLYVGSFEKRKNLMNMIRAFAILRASRPELRFVIVGSQGSRYDVAPTRLPPGVLTVGRVTKQELRILYNQAELFLFTTLYEGFGIPVLEAMACGCPVVTSNVTSLPEVIGDAGVQVDPSDPEAIAAGASRVLQDGVMRSGLVRAGIERAQHFGWEDAARETLETYRRAASSGEG